MMQSIPPTCPLSTNVVYTLLRSLSAILVPEVERVLEMRLVMEGSMTTDEIQKIGHYGVAQISNLGQYGNLHCEKPSVYTKRKD